MKRLDLVDQPDVSPNRKVVAATLGSAIAAVLVGGLVWLFGASQPPPGFEAGLGTVLAFALGYFVREREQPPEDLTTYAYGTGESGQGPPPNQLLTLVILALLVTVLVLLVLSLSGG